MSGQKEEGMSLDLVSEDTPQLVTRLMLPILDATSPLDLRTRIRAMIVGPDFPTVLCSLSDFARAVQLPTGLELPHGESHDLTEMFGSEFVAPIQEVQCKASKLAARGLQIADALGSGGSGPGMLQALRNNPSELLLPVTDGEPAPTEGTVASAALVAALRERRKLPAWLTRELIHLWRHSVETMAEVFMQTDLVPN
jgi:hypothetical protein